MKFKHLSMILISVMILASCATGKVALSKNINVPMSEATVLEKDVAYKIVADTAIKLDVYTNRDDSARLKPVVVFIHGGSWIHGDKSEIKHSYRMALCNALIKEHCAVVSVNYRLADGVNSKFDEELSDCRDAVKWVRRNAAKYHFDSNRIGLWGTSAGAHLSLVLGYQPTDSTNVRFVMDNFGPTNLNSLFMTDLTPLGLGIARIALPELYKERQIMMKIFHDDYCARYSPANMAGWYAVPTLIQHGDKDRLVPISESYELRKVLGRIGTPYNMYVIKGAAHAFPGLTQKQIDDIVEQSMNFAKQYFK